MKSLPPSIAPTYPPAPPPPTYHRARPQPITGSGPSDRFHLLAIAPITGSGPSDRFRLFAVPPITGPGPSDRFRQPARFLLRRPTPLCALAPDHRPLPFQKQGRPPPLQNRPPPPPPPPKDSPNLSPCQAPMIGATTQTGSNTLA